MKFCVLMGSPRPHGNTAELLKPFIMELEEHGCEVTYITLADKHIGQCTGCCACQHVQGEYGCVQRDDVPGIIEEIIASDCIVLATPIYAWYCTAPMKALLDRHYGLNKYYGSATGSLWAGQKLAIIATHGYKDDYATSPFETGVIRLCKHSKLEYMGMYSVRDMGDPAAFRTAQAAAGARDFARKLCLR